MKVEVKNKEKNGAGMNAERNARNDAVGDNNSTVV